MASNLTVEQLKSELIKRRLDPTGNKAVLVARLEEALNTSDDSSEENSQEKKSVSKTPAYHNSNIPIAGPSRPVASASGASGKIGSEFSARCSPDFKIRDVENLLQPFNGDNGWDITIWFDEFERIAVMLNWTEIEKVVYLKRLLTGSAKIFIRTTACHSYSELKEKLLDEFKKNVCKADIYEKLRNRKKKHSETYREYIYKMQEIACLADVDDLSLIHFIVNGIPDREENKSMLYCATNLRELKDRVDIYERIKSKNSVKFSQQFNYASKSTQDSKKKHCFNCGSTEHFKKDCKTATKCFNCNERGHISKNCTKNEHKNQTNLITAQNIKKIKINGHDFTALIDTGSDLTLLREDGLKQLKDINLTKQVINLLGLGTGKSKSIGCFEAALNIDNVKIESTINVVPHNAIRQQCIIGSDVISKARVIFDKDNVTFAESGSRTSDDKATIMNIIIEENEIDVPEKYKDEIGALIRSYKPNKVTESPIKMKIVLNDETAIYSNPRRLPLTEKIIVKQQVEDWLKEEIIRPSNSPFASNIVVARKKNGSHRLCIDYRRLNKQTIKEHFPMPVIDEVLDDLVESKIFTTLDLKNGYFHVPLEEDSIKYTAFITAEGHFEFKRVPFGLMNAPAVFCRFIDYIFRELTTKKIVHTYMDDLIIASKQEEENVNKLKMVLKVAENYGLQINWNKCSFLKRKIEFLGHVVEDGTISPSENKIRAVKNFPEPKNIKDVQSFLGLTGFFRKYIPNYSIIAKPLTELLQKQNSFKIQVEQRIAIEKLKNALATKPVLHIFRQGAEMELHTDASKIGCGAVLTQIADDKKFHPIYYYSRKNQPSEQNYHSYILEVMAVYLALKKFRIYLLGNKFKVITDCIAFRQTMEKKDLPVTVSRWILYMQEFQFEVEHRPNSRMQHVDSLSRNPVVYAIENEILVRIRKSQEADDFIKAVREILKLRNYDDFYMEKDLLFKYLDGKKLLVVPKSMEGEIIKMKHQEGHFAGPKTIHLINEEYFIPNIESKVQHYLKNCVKCLLNSRKLGKQEGFLNPLEKGDTPLETIHLDHIGPMDQTTKQYKYILTVVDGFSKYVWIYPTKTLSAEEVIRKLREQQQYFGNPKRVITDRGSAFTAKSFEEFCIEEGIEHVLITTGVPRGNGQAERINKIIIEVLKKLSAGSPEKWYKYVPQVQVALNSSFQRSIKRTPFEVLFGVKMRKKDHLDIIETIKEVTLQDYDEERDKIRLDVRNQIEKIRQENIKTFNKSRKEGKIYEVGDLVAIKKTQFKVGNKLCAEFLGPYKVISKGRGGRYTVQKTTDAEGPKQTNTSCDFMKPWRCNDPEDFSSFEANDSRMAGCRSYGSSSSVSSQQSV